VLRLWQFIGDDIVLRPSILLPHEGSDIWAEAVGDFPACDSRGGQGCLHAERGCAPFHSEHLDDDLCPSDKRATGICRATGGRDWRSSVVAGDRLTTIRGWPAVPGVDAFGGTVTHSDGVRRRFRMASRNSRRTRRSTTPKAASVKSTDARKPFAVRDSGRPRRRARAAASSPSRDRQPLGSPPRVTVGWRLVPAPSQRRLSAGFAPDHGGGK
jgi:hypothetical protein